MIVTPKIKKWQKLLAKNKAARTDCSHCHLTATCLYIADPITKEVDWLCRECWLRTPLTPEQQAMVAQWQYLPRFVAEKMMRQRWLKNLLGSFEEAESIGRLGLVKAASHFKPELGWQFSTYATDVIKKTIKGEAKARYSLIHIPNQMWAGIYRVSKGEMVDAPHIDKALRALRVNKQEDDGDFKRTSGWPPARDGEPPYEPDEVEKLREMMRRLDFRMRRIVEDYFGIPDGPRMTLAAIAEQEGLSRERVRQIKEKALAELRYYMGHMETVA